jgi:hypothetical protein
MAIAAADARPPWAPRLRVEPANVAAAHALKATAQPRALQAAASVEAPTATSAAGGRIAAGYNRRSGKRRNGESNSHHLPDRDHGSPRSPGEGVIAIADADHHREGAAAMMCRPSRKRRLGSHQRDA